MPRRTRSQIHMRKSFLVRFLKNDPEKSRLEKVTEASSVSSASDQDGSGTNEHMNQWPSGAKHRMICNNMQWPGVLLW